MAEDRKDDPAGTEDAGHDDDVQAHAGRWGVDLEAPADAADVEGHAQFFRTTPAPEGVAVESWERARRDDDADDDTSGHVARCK